MKRSHKIAIARIFDDLIKADRIVDIGEMEYWKNICEKYDITKQIKIEAKEISFAEAVNIICKATVKGLKEDLLTDCKAMTTSDGFCAHSEALIMIALIAMLTPSPLLNCEVFSLPRTNFNIDIATALYIENEYSLEINEVILSLYRSIFKEFQLAGFHFLYIPKIIEHYRNTEETLFKDILSFLAPSISDEGINTIYNSLMEMKTDVFCKDLLCNKCGITALRNTPPSLLIKIGHSYVGESQYSNYFKIKVGNDIFETVKLFIDRFSEMLSSDILIVNTSEERDNQFHFHGFYKQLLDIYLIRKNIRSTITIDPYKEEILFKEIDSQATGLHRREKALYALLLCYGKDGINFTPPKTASGFAQYQNEMQLIQKQYSEIYEKFGGASELASDLSIPEIRRPIISCLLKSLKKLQGLYNPDDYNISKGVDGSLSVNVEPERVFVKQLYSDNPVPLVESEMYCRWSKI